MCSMCYIETRRSNACVEDERGQEVKELTNSLRGAYHAKNLHEFFVAVWGMLQVQSQLYGNHKNTCRLK